VDYEWLKGVASVIAQHGPWAVLAFYLVTKVLNTTKREQDLIAAYNTAIVENTKVTERLAVLIEERTRMRNHDQG
jgi:hypothetical protein